MCNILIQRINRNIMECKVEKYVKKGFKTYGINRNIMECKGAY